MVIQAIRVAPGHQGIQEGVRQGPNGPLTETGLQICPWGFDLADIQTHVHVWHSCRDKSAPISIAKYIAERLPSSSLQTYPDRGHWLAEEVFSTLSTR